MGKRKLKQIAGMTIPKRWRKSAAVVERIVYDPVLSNLVASAIAAGLAAAVRSEPATELKRELQRRAGK